MKNKIVEINIKDIDMPVLSEEDIEKYNRSISYIHIFKCRSNECGLEFAVFSWEIDWGEKFKPYCPECGQQIFVHLRTVKRNRKIHEMVFSENLGNEE